MYWNFFLQMQENMFKTNKITYFESVPTERIHNKNKYLIRYSLSCWMMKYFVFIVHAGSRAYRTRHNNKIASV